MEDEDTKEKEIEMETKPDLMLDVETLGTTNKAAVVQIGACFFDIEMGSIGEKFCKNIQVQDCLDKGLEVDGKAIVWWMEQSNKSWIQNPGPLTKVLADFRAFCYRNKNACVWSHSYFDIPILANAYHAIGEKLPFSYHQVRDIRTLVELSGGARYLANVRKTHNGLDDCLYQIEYVTQAYAILKRDRRKNAEL